VTPAQYHWLGGLGPGGNLMSNRYNWLAEVSPAGDSSAVLDFSGPSFAGVAVNDILNLKVQEIDFGGFGYTLLGGSITLGGNINDYDDHAYLGINTMNLGVALTDRGFLAHTVSVVSGGSLVMNGPVSGPGSLAKAGAGPLTLGGHNSYTGLTYVTAGTLQLGTNNVIPDASWVTVAGGATFDVHGAAETIGSLTGAGNVTLGAGNLHVGGNNAATIFSGVISGANGFVFKEGSGTFILTGANSYAQTVINAGTLRVGAAGAMPAGGAVSVETGATFDVNNLVVAIGALGGSGKVSLGSGALHTGVGSNAYVNFSGVLSGSGDLYKEGAGTLALSSANSYTGATYVNDGTLLVNGSLSASSSVVVGSGLNFIMATLGGTGSVGAITVTGWGNIEAGVNASGTLHCSSAVFNAGSVFTAHAKTQLSATGKIDLSGGPTLLRSDDFSVGRPSNTIIQGATLTGKFNDTYFSNGKYYLQYGAELFLVEYTATGVVLTRVS
jgi:autotransporter-associated beta strand protein